MRANSTEVLRLTGSPWFELSDSASLMASPTSTSMPLSPKTIVAELSPGSCACAVYGRKIRRKRKTNQDWRSSEVNFMVQPSANRRDIPAWAGDSNPGLGRKYSDRYG